MDSSLSAAVPATAASPASPVVVGFQTKKPGGVADSQLSTASITPERMAYLEATLAKLPELDLSETARVKACFSSVLGEGRENIENGLELRVVLGDLGLYPSEDELKLVLYAYRDRLNLVGLARYLRLYKKEFWLNQVSARSNAQQKQNNRSSTGAGNSGAANSGIGNTRKQLAGANPNSTHAAVAAAASSIPHTYTAFSGSHAGPAGTAIAGGSDNDTLRAFVALGGEEDGSGEISAATLRDAIRGFGLTIDIDSMIRSVDVHRSGMLDYVDFCTLWAAPAEGCAADSMGNALRQVSADTEHGSTAGGMIGGAGGGGVNAFTPSEANRRLLSVLLTPSRRSSLAGASQRRSYLPSGGGYDSGMSLPVTPRCGGGGGAGRPLTSGTQQQQQSGADAVSSAVTIRTPVVSAALPAPITEEEHALLVRMFLFPDQFESGGGAASSSVDVSDPAARRFGGARFMQQLRTCPMMSPSRVAAGGAGGGQNVTAGTAAGGGGAANTRRSSLSQRIHTQRQLSRASKSSSRTRNGTRQGGAAHTRGRKGNDNGYSNSGDGNEADDLTADFFSPKNQNVYRPPSPMLLSMRNSTAHRNRVKRLEEQKHAAARSVGGANNNKVNGANRQQHGGLYAAAMTRDSGAGGFGFGGDSGNASRPVKSSTW